VSLVDEAQDTNPAQWQILNALVEEFSAGVGVRDRDAMPRTVFAVGDPKQSIYSFQGAAPHEFEETGRFFQKKLGATGDFANVSLTLSFRSAPAILSAVDAVFSVDAHAEGLSASHPPEKPIHQSARPYASGCVEIWPLLRLDATLAPDPWSLPVDEPESGSPTVRNARRIAEQIKTWLNEGGLWGQHVNAGDILILARKRGAAFEAVIKALKDAGVPVTGSDKLILNNHIAVHDLIAAGKNALHPHDDLNLGAVLVSPLIGWDQDALYDMAVSRGDDTSLWHALEKQALNAEPARVAFEKLKQWQQLAQHSGPFGFYSTLLSAQGGRLALLSRLGVEADDVISAFLSRALDHEHQKTPCLITFLRDLESTQTSVKRDMDTNAQEVRVMTVHGAKGLEAPVVILLDDCKDHKPPPKVINKILNLVDQGTAIPVLVQGKGEDTPALTPHREQADRLIRDEHHRLLYVAMTRARDHLIVAPTIGTKPKEPNDGGWSMMIRKGLSAQQAAQFEMNLVIDTCDESDYPALKWGRWDYKTSPVPIHITAQKPHSPSWLHQPVMNDVRVEPSIMRPSSTVQHGDESTRIRGMIIHTLLQKLPYIPAQQRADKGRRWLAAHATQITDEQQQSWLDDVLSVIDTPELAPLFHENSQAEVAIKGTIQKNGMPVLVSGRIDRIAIFGDRIIIADFKTSLNPPNDQSAIPVSHKQQMRAYRDVLALLYPQKAIETWLVYTAQTTCFKID
jgi:ATP-dependent helicase/nuclease subunit A